MTVFLDVECPFIALATTAVAIDGRVNAGLADCAYFRSTQTLQKNKKILNITQLRLKDRLWCKVVNNSEKFDISGPLLPLCVLL